MAIAAVLVGCAAGNSVLVDTVCIKPGIEAKSFSVSTDGRFAVMNDNSRTILSTNLSYDSDEGEFAEMSLIEKEYSRPYELLICHTEKRIHGIRLTLAMNR